MDKLVYLTYPVLLLIILVGSKWYGKGEWNEEFLSLNQTKNIQGLLAVCIMLHHIGQETCASWQNYPLIPGLEVFVPIGYFFVAFFIFCTGYGLFKSYKAKENYLKGFFGKRILPLILAFYTTEWIFLIARYLMKEKINQTKLINYLTGYQQANPNAWYVIAMPFFYLWFYLSFRFLKWEWLKITSVILFVFAYTFLGTWVDHNDYLMKGEWWYNSVHTFWIGIVFARFEKTIIAKMKKYYWLFLVLAVAGTFGWYVISEWAQAVFSYYGEYNRSLLHWLVVENRWKCLFTQMMASLSFVFAILFLNLKLKIGNRFLEFMGTITLEFYLIHGLVLELFAYKFCDIVPSITRITNVALLIVVVFVPSIFLALALKKCNGFLLRLLLPKKKTS